MTKELIKKPDFNPEWHPSNSHPANALFNLPDFKVLASGIDTLYLSFDVVWPENSAFFSSLAEAKEKAKLIDSDVPLTFQLENSSVWKFNIKKTGSKGGYEWLLMNKEYALKISSATSPKSKPNLIAELRSETLWSNGFKDSCYRIIKFIESRGARILNKKPSRVDLCLDLVFPETMWQESLLDYRVTRADSTAKYFSDTKVKGFTIGKSKIHARIYDKCLEIKQKSNKVWMFDIWKINSVPENKRIIRVEFQLMREVLRELKINSFKELYKNLSSIWSYCTCNWLRFADSPEKRATLRKTLKWWEEVQKGFSNNQSGDPLVRDKIFNAEETRLFNQAYGMLTSLFALNLEQNSARENYKVTFHDCIRRFSSLAMKNEKTDETFFSDVIKKRTKFHRSFEKKCQITLG
jgi:hypothetical protein